MLKVLLDVPGPFHAVRLVHHGDAAGEHARSWVGKPFVAYPTMFWNQYAAPAAILAPENNDAGWLTADDMLEFEVVATDITAARACECVMCRDEQPKRCDSITW